MEMKGPAGRLGGTLMETVVVQEGGGAAVVHICRHTARSGRYDKRGWEGICVQVVL